MVERIRTLIAFRQLTPTQFADLIQVGRPIVSHILSGRNKASLEVVQRIMAALPEVALPWLLSGTGPMLNTSDAIVYDEYSESNQGGRDELSKVVRPALTSRRSAAAANRPAQDSSPPASVAKAVKAGPVTAGPTAQSSGSAGSSQPRRFRPDTANHSVDGQQTPPSPGKLPTNLSPANVLSETVNSASPAQVQAGRVPITNMLAEHTPGPAATPAAPRKTLVEPPQQPLAALSAPPPPSSVAVTPAAWAAAPPQRAFDKPIRRVILFYHDGSFSDFQPES